MHRHPPTITHLSQLALLPAVTFVCQLILPAQLLR